MVYFLLTDVYWILGLKVLSYSCSSFRLAERCLPFLFKRKKI